MKFAARASAILAAVAVVACTDTGPTNPRPITGPPPRFSASAASSASAVMMLWQDTEVTGDRSIWVMNGTSSYSPVLLRNVPKEWSIAGSGDFNGDRQPDIVWQNLKTGERSIWFMDGTTWNGSFTMLPTVPIQWSIAGVGDFNADAQPDLVWQNLTTGERSIWYMNGASYASAEILPTVPREWQIVAVAGFTVRPQPWLLWHNAGTGESSIWYGTSPELPTLLPTVPSAWRIAGAADFDNDDDADIIWQNVNTGERSIWLMNNNEFESAVLLPTVANRWSIAGVLSSGLGQQQGILIPLPAMPAPREFGVAGAINGKIYVATGGSPATLTSTIVYDPVAGNWSEVAAIPTGRVGATGDVIAGLLYVVGGDVSTGVVEAYNPASNSWSTKAPMPTQRMRATARAVNGILYVIGGYNTATSTDVGTVEAYDPSTNSWTTKASMPTARSHAASAVVDGLIYVIGGSAANVKALTTVEVYNPASNTWITRTSLGPACSDSVCPDFSLRGAAAEAIDDRIFVIGGSNSTDGYPEWIVVYDPSIDRWRARSPGGHPQVFRSAASAVLNGTVYVAGGGFGAPLSTFRAYLR